MDGTGSIRPVVLSQNRYTPRDFFPTVRLCWAVLAVVSVGLLAAVSILAIPAMGGDTPRAGAIWLNPRFAATTAGSGPNITYFTISPPTIPEYGMTFLNVTAYVGSGSISYSYTGLPTPCTSDNTPLLTCRPKVTGTFTVEVYVNDSVGRSTTANATFVVTSPPTLPVITAFTVSPNPVTQGDQVQFSLTVSGGALPYTISYGGLPPGCSSANVSELTCIPSSTGNFTVVATVLDNSRNTANASMILVVKAVVTPAPFPWWIVILLIVVAAVAILLLLWIDLRQKKEEDERFMAESATPPAGGAAMYPQQPEPASEGTWEGWGTLPAEPEKPAEPETEEQPKPEPEAAPVAPVAPPKPKPAPIVPEVTLAYTEPQEAPPGYAPTQPEAAATPKCQWCLTPLGPDLKCPHCDKEQKQEAPKAEPAPALAPKTAPRKFKAVQIPAKAPRPETSKTEVASKPVPAEQPETPKVEAAPTPATVPKPEAPKVVESPVPVPTPKTETSKEEAPPTTTPKPEQPKVETPPSPAPKTETPRVETSTAPAPTPKQDAPKAETTPAPTARAVYKTKGKTEQKDKRDTMPGGLAPLLKNCLICGGELEGNYCPKCKVRL
jgi:hypothetical protein